MLSKITPCLWFDHQGEEAANFYVSIFKNSKITGVSHSGGKKGGVMSVNFRLDGQDFIGLNAGPHFKFNPAVSFGAAVMGMFAWPTLWVYLVAQVLAGIAAGVTFLALNPDDK